MSRCARQIRCGWRRRLPTRTRWQGALGRFRSGLEPQWMALGFAHVMGTCRMGRSDDGTCVTDEFGRVWNTDNLYLATVGGVIPNSLAVNPTLAGGAAWRSAARIGCLLSRIRTEHPRSRARVPPGREMSAQSRIRVVDHSLPAEARDEPGRIPGDRLRIARRLGGGTPDLLDEIAVGDRPLGAGLIRARRGGGAACAIPLAPVISAAAIPATSPKLRRYGIGPR